MVDITSKLVSTMSSAGINEVSDSTKKNLRRKLEMEFGDSLTFFTESRHVYIMPDNKYWLLSTYDCHPSWKPLKKATKTTPLSKQPCHCERKLNPWPPKPGELTPDYVHIPPSLQKCLHVLLGGREDGSAGLVNSPRHYHCS